MKRLQRIGSYLAGLIILAAVVWQAAPVRGQTSVVSSQFRVQLDILDRLLVGLSTVTAQFNPDYTQLLSHGTGNNQATTVWQDDRTLTASASEDLDFNGSLTDAYGNSVTCTKLKALVVKAASTNVNDVDVGGSNTTIAGRFGATNDIVSVRPGGLFLYLAASTGVTVTNASADLLTVANSAGSTSVTYDIILLCVE